MLWNMLMLWKASRPLRRFSEEDGMEMVEWAIVATVFAVAAAALWGLLQDDISSAIELTGSTIRTAPVP